MSEQCAAAIAALTELHDWLEGYTTNQRYLEDVIAQLRDSELTEEGKAELRHLLSHDMMFHIKWLGDCYVKEFPASGAPNVHWAWLDYLDDVVDICQEALK